MNRYWDKVAILGPNDCWLWTGATNGVYGKIWGGTYTAAGNPRVALAHRFGYQLIFGPIPVGLLVCHRCDVPLCQNPQDWFLGTYTDNCQDMIGKGRAFYSNVSRNHGDNNPNARLAEWQVEEIRARYTGVRGEQTALAQEYGVSQSLISMIVNRKVRC